jgi:hypothetical protein
MGYDLPNKILGAPEKDYRTYQKFNLDLGKLRINPIENSAKLSTGT